MRLVFEEGKQNKGEVWILRPSLKEIIDFDSVDYRVYKWTWKD